MKSLPIPDAHHLRAAQGWLELGNPVEAFAELDHIAPLLRAHPEVLKLRCQIYQRAKKWDLCIEVASSLVNHLPGDPLGWILRSFALHELKRTQEAYDMLLPVGDRFPQNWTVPYNLACYCAQLRDFPAAESWFKQAMTIDEHTVKRIGIDDPDLTPLWDNLSGTLWKRT